MGRFSKNFLPIFFNVYSQQPAAGEQGNYRMAVLDTIKVYLTVTDTQVSPLFYLFNILIKLFIFVIMLNSNRHNFPPQMICTFLQKATDRMSSTETNEFTR